MDPETLLRTILPELRVPNGNTQIYKEECAYSFHTAESEGGLLMDLLSFVAFSPKFALLNFEKTKHQLYLNIRKNLIKKKTEEATVVGNTIVFDKVYEFEYALVCLPQNKVWPLPASRNELPMKLVQAIDAVISARSAEQSEGIKVFTDDLTLFESKFARGLKQDDNGKKIPPSGWACEVEGCDKKDNLWLNLGDGHIGCGRKNFDGTGGNGHALEHFKQSGHPLVVKLGTITPDGTADVYSYHPSEDDMVKDPLLEDHLAHWGIDMKEMRKTDKSVAELSMDYSMQFDWSRMQENDKALQPMYGPGYTGIANLGNSCYMNSVMQVLFSIPEFQKRYYENADRFFRNSQNPPKDFFVQMAKFAQGLLSGEYSKPPQSTDDGAKAELDDMTAPRPVLFKAMIGEGHREFSTSRQQDAVEFFQYLMDQVERKERAQGENADPSKVFSFKTVERVECSVSHKVKYTEGRNNVLTLPVPTELATNKAEVDEYQKSLQAMTPEQRKEAESRREGLARPNVRLQDCLQAFISPETIEHFYSTAIDARTVALKTTKLGSFPEYLMIQMRKFYVDPGSWVPKKLDVTLDVPDELNLEWMRSNGKTPEEELLPEKEQKEEPAKPQFSEEVVQMLMAMDIPRVRAERASHATIGQDAQAAIEWLFSNMDNPEIDTPLPKAKASVGPAAFVADPASVETLVAMTGMTEAQVTKALKSCDGSLDRAADWLFSRLDDPSSMMDVDEEKPAAAAGAGNPAINVLDGEGKYRLFAMISHMGTSTMSGHYVCHIVKDGKWVLFNDTKVALSVDPPKDLAYLYVYKRV